MRTLSARTTACRVASLLIALLFATPAIATASSGAGNEITFARQIPTGGANVLAANPDGTNVQQVPLSYLAEDFGLPMWSPDRSKLLISTILRLDPAGDLLPFRPATVNLDGSHFNLLEPPNAPDSMGCFGGWYPDGTRLLCSFNGAQPGVFSIRSSDGGDPVRLTTYPYGFCNACDDPTDISPDGKRFVFLRLKNEESRHPEQVALFTENIDGTGLRQLTPYGLAAPHEIAAAQWSPDGREIISETTRGRLFTIHSDGTRLTQIHLQTATSQYFAFEPDFSPDGTRIVFCMTIHGQEDIYTANADGSDVQQVTNTPDFETAPTGDDERHSTASTQSRPRPKRRHRQLRRVKHREQLTAAASTSRAVRGRPIAHVR
jgi:Tol biopolymer transport system component